MRRIETRLRFAQDVPENRAMDDLQPSSSDIRDTPMRIVLVIAISFGFIATHGILAIERKTQEPSPMPVPSAKEEEYRPFDALLQGSPHDTQHPPRTPVRWTKKKKYRVSAGLRKGSTAAHHPPPLAPHRLPQRMNRPS